MLTGTRNLSASATLTICLVVLSAPLSAAADVVDCPPGTHWTGAGCEKDDFDDDLPETGCTQNDPYIGNAPCRIDEYVFSAEHDGYLKRVGDDQIDRYRPPDGELSELGYWTGPRDEGWIYEWRKLSGFSGPGTYAWGEYGYMWLPDGREEPPEVDPEELAQTILDGMNFEPPEIGMAPRPIGQNPDSLGLVGAPTWMWVANPGPTTWGPLVDTGSEGGISVTVTAEVTDAVWDLGDGSTVSCETPGDSYDEAFGVRDSPSCGHRYEHTSGDQPDQAYTVTATTNWTVEWEASTGVDGTLDVDPLTATARVRIGERQLIEQ